MNYKELEQQKVDYKKELKIVKKMYKEVLKMKTDLENKIHKIEEKQSEMIIEKIKKVGV